MYGCYVGLLIVWEGTESTTRRSTRLPKLSRLPIPTGGLWSRIWHQLVHRHHLRVYRLESLLSYRGPGSEFEGVVVAPLHLLFTRHDKGHPPHDAFWRERLPNIMSPFSTVIIFAIVIYLQGFRIEIPVKSNKVCRPRGMYAIKFF